MNEAGTLTTMVYDKENRLKEHKQGAAANTRTFTYDLNSLKQSETFSNATNQLVWDGADMLGEVPAVKPVGAPLMPTRYNLAQGILFATTRFEPAATRTDTGADFIGSILIDFDENGDYVAERRYKPYGELLAGTATTYGWTGNTGSRATLLQYAEQYNRRRHYSTKLKQWTTRDPLWPDESAYGYVRGGPLTWTDPSGERPCSFVERYSCYGECGKYGLRFEDKCQVIYHKVLRITFTQINCNCVPLRKGCKCSAKRLAELNLGEKLLCKSRRSCRTLLAYPPNKKRCPAILELISQNLACKYVQSTINNECFSGGDPGHIKKLKDIETAINVCSRALNFNKCGAYIHGER